VEAVVLAPQDLAQRQVVLVEVVLALGVPLLLAVMVRLILVEVGGVLVINQFHQQVLEDQE
jgi:hypothetical protein